MISLLGKGFTWGGGGGGGGGGRMLRSSQPQTAVKIQWIVVMLEVMLEKGRCRMSRTRAPGTVRGMHNK